MDSPQATSTTAAAEIGPTARISASRKRKNSNDDTTAAGARRYRASRACRSCRARKVRCDVLRNDAGCTNCRLDGRECVLLASRRGKPDRLLDCGPVTSPSPAYPRSSDSACDLSGNAAAHDDELTPETMPAAVETGPNGGDVPVCVTFDGDNEDISKDQQPTDHGLATDYTPSESLDALTFASHDSMSTLLQHYASPRGTVTLPAFIAPFRNKITTEDLEFLARKGALTIPEADLRIEILKGYIFSVYPFMPMLDLKPFVDAVLNERREHPISLLLFQAVMFAGLSSMEPHVLHRLGFDTAKQGREVFFTRVKLLYDFDVESDSAAVFQSLLLMSSWFSKWNEWKDTSHWTAQALLIAQNMGLHREPTSACGSDKIQHLRRRMWWSLFIRDRMIALGTRRPMRIQDDEFDVAMLTLEDFDIEPLNGFGQEQPGLLDAEEQKCTALMCIEMAKLCVCIGHVLSTQYTTLSTTPAVSHTTMVVPKRNGRRSDELHKCDAEINEWLKQFDTNICTSPTISPKVGSTSCSEVHWATLNLAHLTLVNVLHRTQALQPFSNTSEAQSIRTASRLKVKDAAYKVTKIAQTMLHRNQVRFLGLSMITALLAACLSHMADIRSGNDDVRDASIFRFDQNMQVLHSMRGMYATADAAVSFLASVVRKARLPLLAQVTKPAPYFMSASSDHFVYPWTSTHEFVGLGDVTARRDSAGPNAYTPSKAPGTGSPAHQSLSGAQPTTQTHPIASLSASRQIPEKTAPVSAPCTSDPNKDGSTGDLKNFRFDDILFDNVFTSSAEGQAMDLEPILYNYDFYLDNFDFLDCQPQGMK